MNKTFYSYSIELNINDEDVECHDYTVTYDDDTKIPTFSALEAVTGKKYVWQCECEYDDLTEDEHIEMLAYRGIQGVDVATLEDWWMSQIKMRYVGYFDTTKK